MKGYKIHIERIKKTKGKIIRTIKYPLTSYEKNQENNYNFIFNNFINDDQKTRGISNIIDFYKNKKNYSLLDFWVDSLKAGIIFQPTSKTLVDLIKIIRNEKTTAEKIFDNSNEKIKTYFKKREFIEKIILSDSKRSGSSKQGFLNLLINILKDNYIDKKSKKILNNEAKSIIDLIINSFYDEKGSLILETTNEQNKFWKENFNIDKNLLKKEGENKIGEITNFIIPELIKINEQITLEELINLRIKLAKEFLEKINNNNNKYKITESLIGLGNNFNSLSNYLNIFFNFLLEEKYDDIINAYLEIVNLDSLEIEKIKQALIFLSKKAKNLGKPLFINQNWQEYRSIFGGKIQSWYSNYINRIIKSKENYKNFKEGLEKLIDNLKKQNNNINIENLRIKEELKILSISNSLKELIDKNEDIFENTQKFPIFSDYLSEIKTNVNYYFQKYLKKNEEDQIKNNKIFGFLFKKIEKPINFYGQSKKEFLEKIINLTGLKIKNGFEIVKELLEEFNNLKSSNYKKNIYELLDLFFDKLAKKTITSNYLVKEYKKILKKYINKDQNIDKIFEKPDKYAFYKNSYEKQNKKIIKTVENIEKQNSIKDFLYDFYFLLKELSNQNKNFYHNPIIALEYLEISKSLISFFIENSQKKLFNIGKDKFKNFEKVISFINTQKKESYNNEEFNKIINQYFFSDLKGTLNIYSKKFETNKYTLQIIKSQEKFPIIIKFLNDQISYRELIINNKKVINKNHHYFVILDNDFVYKKIKNPEEKTSYFLIDKEMIFPIKIEKINEDLIFKISSSFYQIQFLEKLIYRPKNWQNIKISISEPSFILEVKNKINFDIEKNQINFEVKDKKIFISIPFNIQVKENEIKINQFINHKLYLGIDAGEYGIAYCLTDFSQQNPKIIEANYIKSKNIRKIKDHYHKIQERAKKGLFLSSTSILQEIRENSINEIRNKIHNLYIKYQSPIIYEYSISNFETGSGRITKIYDSIKKSDTIPDNDADKLVIKHIWGVDFLESGKIGKNLSAYGSSYTCSACGKSIYSLFENFEKDNILVLKKLNSNNIKNIIEIKTNYGIIYGYTRDNKFIENYQFEKTKESKNEFIKIIKSFTRPPLEKSEVLISFKKLNKKILKKIKKERGNSAVFVCPFKDCGHVFDADLQAAFIMSIRGFIKDIFKDRKDLNIFEETINYLNNKKINLELLKNQDLFSLLESKNQ